MTYDTILIPTDGSDEIETTLNHAFDVADAFGSTVRALYVEDTARYSVTIVGREIVEAYVRKREKVVAAVIEGGNQRGVSVVTDVVQGELASSIVDYVDLHGVDLIIMNYRSRRGLRQYILGSVTERVAQTTDVPVLVVNPDN